jgi:hypothetical protein
MADSPFSPPLTHTAFAFKREGRRFNSGRWIEVGVGRLDPERNAAFVYLDRLPIGGFSGALQLVPLGETPHPPEPKPARPGQTTEDEDDAGD